MKSKPLNGRESSVLALLAQCPTLNGDDLRDVLSSIDGQAKKIALAIVFPERKHSKRDRAAAKGFIDWAKAIAKRTRSRK